jgi:hypothetical protein
MRKKGLLRNLAIRRVPRLAELAAVMGATVLAASIELQEKAAPSQRDVLIQKASYVFIGTVRLVGASNVKLISGGTTPRSSTSTTSPRGRTQWAISRGTT